MELRLTSMGPTWSPRETIGEQEYRILLFLYNRAKLLRTPDDSNRSLVTTARKTNAKTARRRTHGPQRMQSKMAEAREAQGDPPKIPSLPFLDAQQERGSWEGARLPRQGVLDLSEWKTAACLRRRPFR